MVRFRLALSTFAVLALATAGGRLLADEKGGSNKSEHLDRLAAKLNLTDDQKEQIRKIHTDYDAKTDPVEHKFWVLHREEYEALRNGLTEQQREKLPEALKSMRVREMQKIADELNLTADQKQKISKICEQYEPKFHQLAEDKSNSEQVQNQFRDLRRQIVGEIRTDLNEAQRDKLPMVMREEHRYWRNPETACEHLKTLEIELNVTGDQKEQFHKIIEQYEPKAKAAQTELKKLRGEERAAIEKVFTPEQRTKWQEMSKSWRTGEKSDDRN